MLTSSVLRLNMTGLSRDPHVQAARYAAALDMAEYADRSGFAVVSVEEHHCAQNGWLPAPLVLASMIAARTKRVNVNITALLITLYDPIRLAEDIAVLDLASGGRFSFVAGSGYRPVEYHAMGRDWSARGQLMDEAVETLLKAWTGEAFEYRGNQVRVSPVPLSKPHPPFFIGGMSKAAARRAARFGLPFYPPMKMPELEAYYYAQLEHHETKGFVHYPPDEANAMIFIDEDPDAAWEELAPFFLNEAEEYSRWKQEGVPRPSEELTGSLEDLKAQQRYLILTPEQCRARLQASSTPMAVLHPLAGGIPVERAWSMLQLYVEKVIRPIA